ncbi:MAG: efflux RND transporter permease subunit [Verrucomicrobia bacterium]|nr:efflux RND transporter permease subunit [Verrucomicrobiota bacterium]
MIGQILEFSLRQRAFILVCAAGLVAAGLWSAIHLPVDAVPDITNIQVQINTEVVNLAPEESEKLVTFPVETEMSGLEGLTEIRSLTKFGLSQVTLVFKDGMDIYRARQLVAERLQNVLPELPPGLAPKLAPISTGLGEIFYYTLDYAADATNRPSTRLAQLMELKTLQDYVIKPALRNTPGVAEINTAGGYERQFVVQPRPKDLLAVGLTFSDLAGLIAQNVENAGGGVIHRAGEQIIVRTVGRVQSAEAIAQLPVKFRAGPAPLLVRDVADVVIGTRLRSGAATENGEETVLGTVMMLVGQNSRTVARRVEQRIRELREKLPPGIEIRPVYSRSELVDRTIRTVELNLFEGAVLVVAVLLGLLGNWRAALIVASAIPLSFLFAITGMVQGRVSGNLMSLGAVDFGLIIDGAVVMVENIVRQLALKQHHLGSRLTLEDRLYRHLRLPPPDRGRRLTPPEMRQTVLAASRQVATPMVFGVLIITIVYVPLLALTGIEGKMFRPMAFTVILALVGALGLSLTLMPVLCYYLLRVPVREADNVIVAAVKRLYRPTLELAIRWRWLTVGGAVVLFGVSLGVFLRLGAEFIPQLDEGSYTVMVYRTASTGLPASLAMEQQTERLLRERVPEITHVFSRIGTSEVATDPMPPSQNDLYIAYRPRAEWRREHGRPITKERLAELITAEVRRHLPGQSFMFAQPIEMRFNELLEGIRSDIAVKIYGDDYDVLETLGAKIKDVLGTVPGAADVEFETMGRVPVMGIRLDRDAMRRYNLHAAQVNDAIATALVGQNVGLIFEGNRRHDIVVRLPESLRERLEEIRALPLRTHEGGMVTLGQVARFELAPQVDPIIREFGQRRSAIMVNLSGRDVESFVREAQARVRAEVPLPEGYMVEFGGQFKNLQEARTRLAVVVPAALILIFVLVFAALGSLRQALLVYTGIPLAVTGGVLALAARSMPFSISAAVGFIALSGVAVLNGLVLVSCFNQLRAEGRHVREAVFVGGLTRLRPVLMTALVASFGFLPMALATGPGAEVQRPLATVVIGGILSSTFLTLVFLPAVYAWMEGYTRRPRATPPNPLPQPMTSPAAVPPPGPDGPGP